MEWWHILQKLEEIDEDEIELVIYSLLIKEKLKYENLSKLYVKYLEYKNKLNLNKESLFANCLGSSISKSYGKDKEWFHSQAYVLIKKWLPDEWLEKYLNKKTEEYIILNEKLLEVDE